MTILPIVAACAAVLVSAYLTYGRLVARRLGSDPSRAAPHQPPRFPAVAAHPRSLPRPPLAARRPPGLPFAALPRARPVAPWPPVAPPRPPPAPARAQTPVREVSDHQHSRARGHNREDGHG